jgi:hypothetical protein
MLDGFFTHQRFTHHHTPAALWIFNGRMVPVLVLVFATLPHACPLPGDLATRRLNVVAAGERCCAAPAPDGLRRLAGDGMADIN